MRKFREQELSNIAYALASLGLADEDLLGKIAEAALGLGIGAFQTQGVSNIAWAFGTLGYLNEAFMQARPGAAAPLRAVARAP